MTRIAGMCGIRIGKGRAWIESRDSLGLGKVDSWMVSGGVCGEGWFRFFL
jgi:hypothetical protein